MQQDNQSGWKLQVRVNHLREPIYKTKPISQDQFIIHLPHQKTLKTLDYKLNSCNQPYIFSDEFQAIQHFNFNQSIFVAAGTSVGIIQLQDTNTSETYKLELENKLTGSNKLINDMLFLQNGKLINCYNNGSLAIWDLNILISNQKHPLLSYTPVHNSFTYKIRRVDSSTVITCSNDFYAKLFDIETATVLDSFPHESSVWCAYPLSQHIFCSSGLMDRLVFWDVRSHRIIQKCQLAHSETSFVTRFDSNSIIFGDSKDLCTCDLRRPLKVAFGNSQMKVSAETILVGKNEVIAAGRGGDVCRFIKTEEHINIEERTVGQPFIGATMPRLFVNLPRWFQLAFANEEFEEDEDQDLLEEQHEDDIQIQIQNEEENEIQSDQQYEEIQQMRLDEDPLNPIEINPTVMHEQLHENEESSQIEGQEGQREQQKRNQELTQKKQKE